LEKILKKVFENNPSLFASKAAIDEKKGAKTQARLFPNPQVFAEVEDFSGTGAYSGTGAMSSRIGLEQPLLLGGKLKKRTKVAEMDLKISEIQHLVSIRDLTATVEKNFYAVFSAQEQLKVELEQLELIKKTNWIVQKRVTAGEVSPVDLLKSKVEIGSAEIQVAQSKKNLRSARKRLMALWGEKTDRPFTVLGKFRGSRDFPELSVGESLKQSPIWALNEAKSQKVEAELLLEKARRIPDLSLEGGLQRFNETDDRSFFLGVRLDLPVFNRNQGAIATKKASVIKEKYLKEAEFNAFFSYLNTTWNDLSANKKALVVLETELVPASKSAYKSMRKLYQAGEIDILPLVDAQRTWIKTQGNRIEILSLIETNIIEIQRILGAIPSTQATIQE